MLTDWCVSKYSFSARNFMTPTNVTTKNGVAFPPKMNSKTNLRPENLYVNRSLTKIYERSTQGGNSDYNTKNYTRSFNSS